MTRSTFLASLFLLASACGTEPVPAEQTTGDDLTGKADRAQCSRSRPCADGQRCFEGRCVEELCDDQSPCSKGGFCYDGACCYSESDCGFCDDEDCGLASRACAANADCGKNERCYNQQCVAATCDAQHACSTGGMCKSGACCYSTTDCAKVGAGASACAKDADCRGNQRCFEKKCVVDLCDDKTSCSSGGVCYDGACCYSPEECGICDSEDCM